MLSVYLLMTLGVTIFCRSWNYSLSMIVLNVSFWSELCVCMKMGTLMGAWCLLLRKVNKNTVTSDKKSVECLSNNWDLFVGSSKVGVIPQNITTKEKFESWGIWYRNDIYTVFWM